MFWWQVSAALHLLRASVFGLIACTVLCGLRRAGQLRSNRLGVLLGVLLVVSGLEQLQMAYALLAPTVGLDVTVGTGARQAASWPGSIVDVVCVVIASAYLWDRRVHGDRLGASLFPDVSRNRAETVLREQAFKDSLTRLPNRAAFKDRLSATRGRGRHRSCSSTWTGSSW